MFSVIRAHARGYKVQSRVFCFKRNLVFSNAVFRSPQRNVRRVFFWKTINSSDSSSLELKVIRIFIYGDF